MAFWDAALFISNSKYPPALDPAFMLRLRFFLEFLYPGPEGRKNIWLKVFSLDANVDELDCNRLASMAITGGDLQNISLNAAFLAAAEKTPITMKPVLEATRTDFRKESSLHRG